MGALVRRLHAVCRGRPRFVGLGNADLGDDGAGLALAARLHQAGCPQVLEVGTHPDRYVSRMAAPGADAVLLLDAVDAGAAPGSVILLDAAEAAARYPQLSTHKLSLALLARLVRALGGPPVSLLGIQPASLRPAAALSRPVAESVAVLAELLATSDRSADAVGARRGACP